MLRIFQAFAWLKWRTLINAIDHGGGRDVMARFSVAIEQLAPIVLGLVLIPSALALAGAGAYAGASLAEGRPDAPVVQVLRLALLAGGAAAVVSPLISPAAGLPNPVRLLLLPIPGAVLYLGQALSILAGPWMLLVAAPLLAVPAGLAAGGAAGAAGVAVPGGVLLLVLLAGVTLGVSSALQLVVRNRRRGELVALLLLLSLPVIGMAPELIGAPRGTQPGVLAYVPSEIYVRAIRSAAAGDSGGSIRGLAALAALAAVIHAGALVAVSRLLHSSNLSDTGRSGAARAARAWRVPGVSPATSAVAVNQVRLALRTPRGRFSLLSPLMLFVMLAVVLLRSTTGEIELGLVRLPGGVGLAAFSAATALLAILPLAMNQFATDGAGLTLMMLTPLEAAALLRGKAIGNALIAAVPAGLCLAAAGLLFPGGEPALWLCLPLTFAATYLLLAPAAAVLSMLFPRVVNLNSIGSGSNAHGAAMLLGTLALAAAAAMSTAPVAIAIGLQRPALAPLFVLLWTGVCGGAGIALFRAAASLYARRREQLGMLVG